jgi:hypothetical protein
MVLRENPQVCAEGPELEVKGAARRRVVATSDKLLGGAKDWLFVFQRH